MQDNDRSPLAEGMRGMIIARDMNIAANGRWGMLGMAAVALQQDLAIFAFLFVLGLLLAYVIEQLPQPIRYICALAVGTWGAILTMAFFFVLLWQ